MPDLYTGSGSAIHQGLLVVFHDRMFHRCLHQIYFYLNLICHPGVLRGGLNYAKTGF